MEQILILNAGSSTLKFRLYQYLGDSFSKGTPKAILHGSASHIGSDKGDIRIEHDTGKFEPITGSFNGTHNKALKAIVEILREQKLLENVRGVGHRVVHGGPNFEGPCIIDNETMAQMDKLTELAPLHNHAAVTLIEAVRSVFPKAQHVAVFDTTFHRDMPEYASNYALPAQMCRDKQVRRYGFHGISHRFVAQRTAEALDQTLQQSSLITLHLGSGASACAIKRGVSVDTSMGFTPLEGLIMGTRAGDTDASVIFHIMENPLHKVPALSTDPDGPHISQAEDVLNHNSGLKGICGESDLGRIVSLMQNNDTPSEDRHAYTLAFDMFCYRVAKYVGSYHIAVDGAQAIAFTGGIGEHNALVRQKVAEHIRCLGIQLDQNANKNAGELLDRHNGLVCISSPSSSIKLFVVATDEEGEIAKEVVSKLK